MTIEYLKNRKLFLEKTITDAEATIIRNMTSGVGEYWLNTGQTESKVKYTSLKVLREEINNWRNELYEIMAHLDPCNSNGRSIAYV